MSRQKFSHLNWPWPYFISMVIECRSLITLTVAIVVSVEKKNRYLPDKSTKKHTNIKEKGSYWTPEGETRAEAVTQDTRWPPIGTEFWLLLSPWKQRPDHTETWQIFLLACLQNCFLNKHFVIKFSTNKMCAFAYFAIYTLTEIQ